MWKSIRKSTKKSLPLGGEDFTKQLSADKDKRVSLEKGGIIPSPSSRAQCYRTCSCKLLHGEMARTIEGLGLTAF